MPVIVETGSNTFKFIEDGRAPDASANYTYVRADEWPQQLQYMLDRDYDTTPSSGNALTAPAPSAARGRGPQAQGSSQSGGRSVSRSAGPVGAGGNSYAQRDRTASLDRTSQPLVNQAGGSQPQRAQGTAHGLPLAAWEQSPGIPPEPSSWLQYTPPGESAPGWGEQSAGIPSANPQPAGRPTTGDLLYQQSQLVGRGDPTQSPGGYGGRISDYYSPQAHAENRASLAGDPALDQAFPWLSQSPGMPEQPQTYDFGRVDSVMGALQSGEFVPQQPYDPTAGWKYPPGSRQYGMGTAVMPQRDRGSELGAGGFVFEPRFKTSSSAQPVTIVQANGQVLTRDPVTGEWR